jgi:hypothetical protein
VHEARNSRLQGLVSHSASSFDVYSIESLRPAFDIEADRIHHAIGAFNSCGDGSFVIDICKDRIASGIEDLVPLKMP